MTKDTRKEGYTELIPSKVTEIYHREMEFINNLIIRLCTCYIRNY